MATFLNAGQYAIGGYKMSLRADGFSPVEDDDTASAAPWGVGLTLLGVAVSVIMLGAVFPEFFRAGLDLSDLGFP